MVAQDRETIEELEEQLSRATHTSSGDGGTSLPQQDYDAHESCVIVAALPH